MAEVAMAAFSAVSAAAPALSTVGSVLQGVATAGSVLMGVMQARHTQEAGQAQAQEARMQSELVRLEGDRDAVASRARADALRRETLIKVGNARVAFAGAGLDISSRQLDTTEGSLNSDLSYGLAIEKSNRAIKRAETSISQGQLSLQASNAVSGANAQSTAQLVGTGVAGARGLLSIINRK
jgi:hypothetical protein